MPDDLSHLPPAAPDDIRALVKRAGLDLPEELLQQFIAAWPAYEQMVRRIPRGRRISAASCATACCPAR